MRILSVSLSACLVALAGCGGGGTVNDNCDPSTYPDICPMGHGCDAVTKKCVALASCTGSDTCAGFACNISDLCVRNCTGPSGPDDSQCSIGYLCDKTLLTCGKATTCDPGQGSSGCNGLICDVATMMCVVGAECSFDDDCGTYACDQTAGCYTSCEDFSQCGSNYMCDFFTNRCS